MYETQLFKNNEKDILIDADMMKKIVHKNVSHDIDKMILHGKPLTSFKISKANQYKENDLSEYENNSIADVFMDKNIWYKFKTFKGENYFLKEDDSSNIINLKIIDQDDKIHTIKEGDNFVVDYHKITSGSKYVQTQVDQYVLTLYDNMPYDRNLKLIRGFTYYININTNQSLNLYDISGNPYSTGITLKDSSSESIQNVGKGNQWIWDVNDDGSSNKIIECKHGGNLLVNFEIVSNLYVMNNQLKNGWLNEWKNDPHAKKIETKFKTNRKFQILDTRMNKEISNVMKNQNTKKGYNEHFFKDNSDYVDEIKVSNDVFEKYIHNKTKNELNKRNSDSKYAITNHKIKNLHTNENILDFEEDDNNTVTETNIKKATSWKTLKLRNKEYQMKIDSENLILKPHPYDKKTTQFTMKKGDKIVEDKHILILDEQNTLQIITAPDVFRLHVETDGSRLIWNNEKRDIINIVKGNEYHIYIDTPGKPISIQNGKEYLKWSNETETNTITDINTDNKTDGKWILQINKDTNVKYLHVQSKDELLTTIKVIDDLLIDKIKDGSNEKIKLKSDWYKNEKYLNIKTNKNHIDLRHNPEINDRIDDLIKNVTKEIKTIQPNTDLYHKNKYNHTKELKGKFYNEELFKNNEKSVLLDEDKMKELVPKPVKDHIESLKNTEHEIQKFKIIKNKHLKNINLHDEDENTFFELDISEQNDNEYKLMTKRKGEFKMKDISNNRLEISPHPKTPKNLESKLILEENDEYVIDQHKFWKNSNYLLISPGIFKLYLSINDQGNYEWNNDPKFQNLKLVRGKTYYIDIDTSGHPLRIQNVSANISGNTYSTGISWKDPSNGAIITDNVHNKEKGTLIWNVSNDLSHNLFYQCGNDSGIWGEIEILDIGDRYTTKDSSNNIKIKQNWRTEYEKDPHKVKNDKYYDLRNEDIDNRFKQKIEFVKNDLLNKNILSNDKTYHDEKYKQMKVFKRDIVKDELFKDTSDNLPILINKEVMKGFSNNKVHNKIEKYEDSYNNIKKFKIMNPKPEEPMIDLSVEDEDTMIDVNFDSDDNDTYTLKLKIDGNNYYNHQDGNRMTDPNVNWYRDTSNFKYILHKKDKLYSSIDSKKSQILTWKINKDISNNIVIRPNPFSSDQSGTLVMSDNPGNKEVKEMLIGNYHFIKGSLNVTYQQSKHLYQHLFENNYYQIYKDTLHLNDGQNVQMTNIPLNLSSDGQYLTLIGNGIPNYIPKIMGFDVTNGFNNIAGDKSFSGLKFSEKNGRNNPNGIEIQNQTFYIPLDPSHNPSGSTDTKLGTVGVALNGIPIYNPFDGPNNESAYGRLFSGCCGHPQQDGVYHYHKYPTCLKLIDNTWKSEKEKCDELDALVENKGHSPLIGFANDGYPIYGPVGYKQNVDTSETFILKSSYIGPEDSSKNPTYVDGSGDLDECNGIYSKTPEYPDGIYHYVMTIKSKENGKNVDREINPYFGYDIRNILYKHLDASNLNFEDDLNYYNALKNGFTLTLTNGNNVEVKGTDASNSFYEFIKNMQQTFKDQSLNDIAEEFDTMQIAYPFTIIKYKGVVPNLTSTGITHSQNQYGNDRNDIQIPSLNIGGIRNFVISFTRHDHPPIPTGNPNSLKIDNKEILFTTTTSDLSANMYKRKSFDIFEGEIDLSDATKGTKDVEIKFSGGIDNSGIIYKTTVEFTEPTPNRKILCLHRGGQSKESFESMMSEFKDNLTTYDFVFADAPENYNVWIKDPPGGKSRPTRSPNWAEKSVKYLNDLIISKGPFYAILGYSQGAAMIVTYLSNRDDYQTMFEKVILFNGYLPKTHNGLMTKINNKKPFKIPSLHFTSQNDIIIKPSLSKELQNVFIDIGDVMLQESKNAGHAPPEKDEDLEIFNNIINFINLKPKKIVEGKQDDSSWDSVKKIEIKKDTSLNIVHQPRDLKIIEEEPIKTSVSYYRYEIKIEKVKEINQNIYESNRNDETIQFRPNQDAYYKTSVHLTKNDIEIKYKHQNAFYERQKVSKKYETDKQFDEYVDHAEVFIVKTVHDSSGGKDVFVIDNDTDFALNLYSGKTYIFDLSDKSNEKDKIQFKINNEIKKIRDGEDYIEYNVPQQHKFPYLQTSIQISKDNNTSQGVVSMGDNYNPTSTSLGKLNVTKVEIDQSWFINKNQKNGVYDVSDDNKFKSLFRQINFDSDEYKNTEYVQNMMNTLMPYMPIQIDIISAKHLVPHQVKTEIIDREGTTIEFKYMYITKDSPFDTSNIPHNTLIFINTTSKDWSEIRIGDDAYFFKESKDGNEILYKPDINYDKKHDKTAQLMKNTYITIQNKTVFFGSVIIYENKIIQTKIENKQIQTFDKNTIGNNNNSIWCDDDMCARLSILQPWSMADRGSSATSKEINDVIEGWEGRILNPDASGGIKHPCNNMKMRILSYGWTSDAVGLVPGKGVLPRMRKVDMFLSKTLDKIFTSQDIDSTIKLSGTNKIEWDGVNYHVDFIDYEQVINKLQFIKDGYGQKIHYSDGQQNLYCWQNSAYASHIMRNNYPNQFFITNSSQNSNETWTIQNLYTVDAGRVLPCYNNNDILQNYTVRRESSRISPGFYMPIPYGSNQKFRFITVKQVLEGDFEFIVSSKRFYSICCYYGKNIQLSDLHNETSYLGERFEGPYGLHTWQDAHPPAKTEWLPPGTTEMGIVTMDSSGWTSKSDSTYGQTGITPNNPTGDEGWIGGLTTRYQNAIRTVFEAGSWKTTETKNEYFIKIKRNNNTISATHTAEDGDYTLWTKQIPSDAKCMPLWGLKDAVDPVDASMTSCYLQNYSVDDYTIPNFTYVDDIVKIVDSSSNVKYFINPKNGNGSNQNQPKYIETAFIQNDDSRRDQLWGTKSANILDLNSSSYKTVLCQRYKVINKNTITMRPPIKSTLSQFCNFESINWSVGFQSNKDPLIDSSCSKILELRSESYLYKAIKTTNNKTTMISCKFHDSNNPAWTPKRELPLFYYDRGDNEVSMKPLKPMTKWGLQKLPFVLNNALSDKVPRGSWPISELISVRGIPEDCELHPDNMVARQMVDGSDIITNEYQTYNIKDALNMFRISHFTFGTLYKDTLRHVHYWNKLAISHQNEFIEVLKLPWTFGEFTDSYNVHENGPSNVWIKNKDIGIDAPDKGFYGDNNAKIYFTKQAAHNGENSKEMYMKRGDPFIKKFKADKIVNILKCLYDENMRTHILDKCSATVASYYRTLLLSTLTIEYDVSCLDYTDYEIRRINHSGTYGHLGLLDKLIVIYKGTRYYDPGQLGRPRAGHEAAAFYRANVYLSGHFPNGVQYYGLDKTQHLAHIDMNRDDPRPLTQYGDLHDWRTGRPLNYGSRLTDLSDYVYVFYTTDPGYYLVDPDRDETWREHSPGSWGYTPTTYLENGFNARHWGMDKSMGTGSSLMTKGVLLPKYSQLGISETMPSDESYDDYKDEFRIGINGPTNYNEIHSNIRAALPIVDRWLLPSTSAIYKQPFLELRTGGLKSGTITVSDSNREYCEKYFKTSVNDVFAYPNNVEIDTAPFRFIHKDLVPYFEREYILDLMSIPKTTLKIPNFYALSNEKGDRKLYDARFEIDITNAIITQNNGTEISNILFKEETLNPLEDTSLQMQNITTQLIPIGGVDWENKKYRDLYGESSTYTLQSESIYNNGNASFSNHYYGHKGVWTNPWTHAREENKNLWPVIRLHTLEMPGDSDFEVIFYNKNGFFKYPQNVHGYACKIEYGDNYVLAYTYGTYGGEPQKYKYIRCKSVNNVLTISFAEHKDNIPASDQPDSTWHQASSASHSGHQTGFQSVNQPFSNPPQNQPNAVPNNSSKSTGKIYLNSIYEYWGRFNFTSNPEIIYVGKTYSKSSFKNVNSYTIKNRDVPKIWNGNMKVIPSGTTNNLEINLSSNDKIKGYISISHASYTFYHNTGKEHDTSMNLILKGNLTGGFFNSLNHNNIEHLLKELTTTNFYHNLNFNDLFVSTKRRLQPITETTLRAIQNDKEAVFSQSIAGKINTINIKKIEQNGNAQVVDELNNKGTLSYNDTSGAVINLFYQKNDLKFYIKNSNGMLDDTGRKYTPLVNPHAITVNQPLVGDFTLISTWKQNYICSGILYAENLSSSTFTNENNAYGTSQDYLFDTNPKNERHNSTNNGFSGGQWIGLRPENTDDLNPKVLKPRLIKELRITPIGTLTSWKNKLRYIGVYEDDNYMDLPGSYKELTVGNLGPNPGPGYNGWANTLPEDKYHFIFHDSSGFNVDVDISYIHFNGWPSGLTGFKVEFKSSLYPEWQTIDAYRVKAKGDYADNCIDKTKLLNSTNYHQDWFIGEFSSEDKAELDIKPTILISILDQGNNNPGIGDGDSDPKYKHIGIWTSGGQSNLHNYLTRRYGVHQSHFLIPNGGTLHTYKEKTYTDINQNTKVVGKYYKRVERSCLAISVSMGGHVVVTFKDSSSSEFQTKSFSVFGRTDPWGATIQDEITEVKRYALVRSITYNVPGGIFKHVNFDTESTSATTIINGKIVYHAPSPYQDDIYAGKWVYPGLVDRHGKSIYIGYKAHSDPTKSQGHFGSNGLLYHLDPASIENKEIVLYPTPKYEDSNFHNIKDATRYIKHQRIGNDISISFGMLRDEGGFIDASPATAINRLITLDSSSNEWNRSFTVRVGPDDECMPSWYSQSLGENKLKLKYVNIVTVTTPGVNAVYTAPGIANMKGAFILRDGLNTVTIIDSSYNSVEQQVTAIRTHNDYGKLNYIVSKDEQSDNFKMTYKISEPISNVNTPTLSRVSEEISGVNPVNAVYSTPGIANMKGALILRDGSNTVTIIDSSYNSISEQVDAIITHADYEKLAYDVSANGHNFKMKYRNPSFIESSNTPTFSRVSLVSNGFIGVNAIYTAPAIPAMKGVLEFRDVSANVKIDSSNYNTVIDQVNAITNHNDYNKLNFFISVDGNNFKISYKNPGTIVNTPTLTRVGEVTPGVTPVNEVYKVNMEIDSSSGVFKRVELSDGFNTVSMPDSSYNSIAGWVNAIQNHSNYKHLLFDFETKDGFFFIKYNDAGPIENAPTFSIFEDGSMVPVDIVKHIFGVVGEKAVYICPAIQKNMNGILEVSDGSSTVLINSSNYSNISDQVTAITGHADYNKLAFDVSENGNNFKITYKNPGTIENAPTFFTSVETVTHGVSGETAVYEAPAQSNMKGILEISDGSSSVTVDSSNYSTISDQVTAITSRYTDYNKLDFILYADDNRFKMKYKNTGTIENAPTFFTGVDLEIPGVDGVKAVYTSPAIPNMNGILEVHDGSATVLIDSSNYGNVEQQVNEITSHGNYEKLAFDVSANGNNFKITYKNIGVISNAPTFFTGVDAVTSGVTKVIIDNSNTSHITTNIEITNPNVKLLKHGSFKNNQGVHNLNPEYRHLTQIWSGKYNGVDFEGTLKFKIQSYADWARDMANNLNSNIVNTRKEDMVLNGRWVLLRNNMYKDKSLDSKWDLIDKIYLGTDETEEIYLNDNQFNMLMKPYFKIIDKSEIKPIPQHYRVSEMIDIINYKNLPVYPDKFNVISKFPSGGVGIQPTPAPESLFRYGEHGEYGSNEILLTDMSNKIQLVKFANYRLSAMTILLAKSKVDRIWNYVNKININKNQSYKKEWKDVSGKDPNIEGKYIKTNSSVRPYFSIDSEVQVLHPVDISGQLYHESMNFPEDTNNYHDKTMVWKDGYITNIKPFVMSETWPGPKSKDEILNMYMHHYEFIANVLSKVPPEWKYTVTQKLFKQLVGNVYTVKLHKPENGTFDYFSQQMRQTTRINNFMSGYYNSKQLSFDNGVGPIAATSGSELNYENNYLLSEYQNEDANIVAGIIKDIPETEKTETLIFKTDDTWKVPADIKNNKIKILVVGGGGAGGAMHPPMYWGCYKSAGGGGGGLVYIEDFDISDVIGKTFDIKIGEGGNYGWIAGDYNLRTPLDKKDATGKHTTVIIEGSEEIRKGLVAYGGLPGEAGNPGDTAYYNKYHIPQLINGNRTYGSTGGTLSVNRHDHVEVDETQESGQRIHSTDMINVKYYQYQEFGTTYSNTGFSNKGKKDGGGGGAGGNAVDLKGGDGKNFSADFNIELPNSGWFAGGGSTVFVNDPYSPATSSSNGGGGYGYNLRGGGDTWFNVDVNKPLGYTHGKPNTGGGGGSNGNGGSGIVIIEYVKNLISSTTDIYTFCHEGVSTSSWDTFVSRMNTNQSLYPTVATGDDRNRLKLFKNLQYSNGVKNGSTITWGKDCKILIDGKDETDQANSYVLLTLQDKLLVTNDNPHMKLEIKSEYAEVKSTPFISIRNDDLLYGFNNFISAELSESEKGAKFDDLSKDTLFAHRYNIYHKWAAFQKDDINKFIEIIDNKIYLSDNVNFVNKKQVIYDSPGHFTEWGPEPVDSNFRIQWQNGTNHIHEDFPSLNFRKYPFSLSSNNRITTGKYKITNIITVNDPSWNSISHNPRTILEDRSSTQWNGHPSLDPHPTPPITLGWPPVPWDYTAHDAHYGLLDLVNSDMFLHLGFSNTFKYPSNNNLSTSIGLLKLSPTSNQTISLKSDELTKWDTQMITVQNGIYTDFVMISYSTTDIITPAMYVYKTNLYKTNKLANVAPQLWNYGSGITKGVYGNTGKSFVYCNTGWPGHANYIQATGFPDVGSNGRSARWVGRRYQGVYGIPKYIRHERKNNTVYVSIGILESDNGKLPSVDSLVDLSYNDHRWEWFFEEDGKSSSVPSNEHSALRFRDSHGELFYTGVWYGAPNYKFSPGEWAQSYDVVFPAWYTEPDGRNANLIADGDFKIVQLEFKNHMYNSLEKQLHLKPQVLSTPENDVFLAKIICQKIDNSGNILNDNSDNIIQINNPHGAQTKSFIQNFFNNLQNPINSVTNFVIRPNEIEYIFKHLPDFSNIIPDAAQNLFTWMEIKNLYCELYKHLHVNYQNLISDGTSSSIKRYYEEIDITNDTHVAFPNNMTSSSNIPASLRINRSDNLTDYSIPYYGDKLEYKLNRGGKILQNTGFGLEYLPGHYQNYTKFMMSDDTGTIRIPISKIKAHIEERAVSFRLTGVRQHNRVAKIAGSDKILRKCAFKESSTTYSQGEWQTLYAFSHYDLGKKMTIQGDEVLINNIKREMLPNSWYYALHGNVLPINKDGYTHDPYLYTVEEKLHGNVTLKYKLCPKCKVNASPFEIAKGQYHLPITTSATIQNPPNLFWVQSSNFAVQGKEGTKLLFTFNDVGATIFFKRSEQVKVSDSTDYVGPIQVQRGNSDRITHNVRWKLLEGRNASYYKSYSGRRDLSPQEIPELNRYLITKVDDTKIEYIDYQKTPTGSVHSWGMHSSYNGKYEISNPIINPEVKVNLPSYRMPILKNESAFVGELHGVFIDDRTKANIRPGESATGDLGLGLYTKLDLDYYSPIYTPPIGGYSRLDNQGYNIISDITYYKQDTTADDCVEISIEPDGIEFEAEILWRYKL